MFGSLVSGATSVAKAVGSVVTSSAFQSGLSLTLTAANAYTQYNAAKKAESRMEAASKTQASINTLNERAMAAEQAETQRRSQADMQRQESLARAKAAASGTNISQGSTGAYLGFLESENLKQYDWMVQSGQSSLNIAKQTGASQVKATKDTAKGLRDQATSTAIKGAQDIYASGLNSGWWGK